MSGIETLRRVREKHPGLPVLLVTAFADIRTAVAAMRDGAVNYLAKPIDLDELMTSVRRALGSEAVAMPAASPFPVPEGVIVRSPLMQAVFRDVAAIAPSDSRVLITGESCVGKEVVAVEVVRSLVGSIGLVASVPISTALAAMVVGATTDRKSR